MNFSHRPRLTAQGRLRANGSCSSDGPLHLRYQPLKFWRTAVRGGPAVGLRSPSGSTRPIAEVHGEFKHVSKSAMEFKTVPKLYDFPLPSRMLVKRWMERA